jgi:hypothetical protein
MVALCTRSLFLFSFVPFFTAHGGSKTAFYHSMAMKYLDVVKTSRSVCKLNKQETRFNNDRIRLGARWSMIEPATVRAAATSSKNMVVNLVAEQKFEVESD